MLKSKGDPSIPPVAAERASLTYVSDDMPGIRRHRRGRGFFYILPNGERLTDPNEIRRINSLAIPPAYTDVWISPDPDGHLQATGRDDRGRKQYRYHPRWNAIRDEAKFDRLADFAGALPALREQMETDLRKHGLPKERVVAAVIWLLENTMIRVGNHTYARDNKSFGLTTLRNRHVAVEGSRLRFHFKGKSGKEWNLQLVDRRIVRIVRSIQDLPGQHLFQYLDDGGERRQIRSDDINAYIQDTMGPDFSSKSIRTWSGTLAGLSILAGTELPEGKAATQRVLNKAIDRVAALLGNTRAVCRQCYIHPHVIESWLAGTLPDELATARRAFRKIKPGLDEAEMVALKWLEQQRTD